MGKKKKNRVGVTYSTNPDFDYQYESNEEMGQVDPADQSLRVMRDRKQRKGKTVILVSGFEGPESAFKALGKTLKSKCGTGGTVKDGEIIIQGDMLQKVVDILIDLGYKHTKRVGG